MMRGCWETHGSAGCWASVNNTFALTVPICHTRQSLLGKMHELLGKFWSYVQSNPACDPERKQALMSRWVLSLIPMVDSGQHLKLLLTSLRCGPRSLCQRIIGLKYFYGGPEGWGLTYPASILLILAVSLALSVLPQIGVVLQFYQRSMSQSPYRFAKLQLESSSLHISCSCSGSL